MNLLNFLHQLKTIQAENGHHMHVKIIPPPVVLGDTCCHQHRDISFTVCQRTVNSVTTTWLEIQQ